MEIRIEQYGKKWGFELVSGNQQVVMQSANCYTHKRNAVAAARTIAGSTIKVVVEA